MEKSDALLHDERQMVSYSFYNSNGPDKNQAAIAP
jgi:hypothetical protein